MLRHGELKGIFTKVFVGKNIDNFKKRKMTAKELLNPRFEVIAEYPRCEFKKGDIIERPNFNLDFVATAWIEYKEKFPHLFKKLNWWEHRSVEDMPKKLVSNMPHNTGEIKFVESWHLDKLLVVFNTQKREYSCFMDWDSEKCYLPKD